MELEVLLVTICEDDEDWKFFEISMGACERWSIFYYGSAKMLEDKAIVEIIIELTQLNRLNSLKLIDSMSWLVS